MNFLPPLVSRANANAREAWLPIRIAPEIYQLAVLMFSDGSQRRGSWNGKFWWGYDERVRRSRPLEPVAWRPIA
jgi:hypothetical protein